MPVPLTDVAMAMKSNQSTTEVALQKVDSDYDSYDEIDNHLYDL